MLAKIFNLQILVLCLIQNTFSNQIDYNTNQTQNENNKIQQKSNQMVLNKNNNKQVYNYDSSTGAYVLANQKSVDETQQNESIYELDPVTGRYRLTKKAKKQILEKYDSRTITQDLNAQLKNIITAILECNNINNVSSINTNLNNIIIRFITQNKLSKQYVKGIWEAWYNKYMKSLNTKLIQLCNNNTDVYKSISKINIFNIDSATRFIDAI